MGVGRRWEWNTRCCASFFLKSAAPRSRCVLLEGCADTGQRSPEPWHDVPVIVSKKFSTSAAAPRTCMSSHSFVTSLRISRFAHWASAFRDGFKAHAGKMTGAPLRLRFQVFRSHKNCHQIKKMRDSNQNSKSATLQDRASLCGNDVTCHFRESFRNAQLL